MQQQKGKGNTLYPDQPLKHHTMKYNITLEHEDFVLLLYALKQSQERDVITRSATDMICEHTKVEL